MSRTITGIEPRRAAWNVLLEQDVRGAFLKDLFPAHLAALSPADAALARAICFGVLRNRHLLDHNLDAHASRGIKDRSLRMLLRVAAQQLLLLDGVPAFAAVDTAVELAKEAFGKHAAGFANAVLKAVARDGLRAPEGNTFKAMAVRHSHPDWMVRRIAAELGAHAVEPVLRRNNEEAPLWIRANPRRGAAQELVDALAADGVALESHPEAAGFFRVTDGAARALRGEAFERGLFAAQDPVAYWVLRLLDWRPGLRMLDACAAPGGKSALAVELAIADGHVTAGAGIVCADVSSGRLARLHDVRVRLGHSGLAPVAADLARAPFRAVDAGGGFDRILVDAPCSNLGVLRRRPEARWNWTPEAIARLAERQAAILRGAAALLRPGGRLVYATCSAEAEETVDVVRAFLAEHPEFRLHDASERVPAALCRAGCLRAWPGETEYDGFFAAALERTGGDS